MIGIMAALPEEIHSLVGALECDRIVERGLRAYHVGRLEGVSCVLVHSRIGKVAASSTATQLIEHFGVKELLFTGVSGAVAPELRQGDIVVGTELFQHDLDASPIFPAYEVPMLGISRFKTDAAAAERLKISALSLAAELGGSGGRLPRVQTGLIASGDQFFSSAEQVNQLRNKHPDVLCVEMEGAAVAQVCHEQGIPFSIVRTISDGANESAPGHYEGFLERMAGVYALGVVGRFLKESKA